MADALAIKMRRVGERRTWPFRRLRPEYEIVIVDGGNEIYGGTTTAPSAVLVGKGKVHTTDSYDWIRAADDAYTPQRESWVSSPLWGHSAT
jgi:hypothetical protein